MTRAPRCPESAAACDQVTITHARSSRLTITLYQSPFVSRMYAVWGTLLSPLTHVHSRTLCVTAPNRSSRPSHTQTQQRSHFLSHTCTHAVTRSHTRALAPLKHGVALFHTLKHALSLTHTHSHTRSLSLTQTCSCSHTHSRSLAHLHTPSLTYLHSHSHSLSETQVDDGGACKRDG